MHPTAIALRCRSFLSLLCFWLHWVFGIAVRCCTGNFLYGWQAGLLFILVPRLLIAVASLVAGHRLAGSGVVKHKFAPRHVGSFWNQDWDSALSCPYYQG